MKRTSIGLLFYLGFLGVLGVLGLEKIREHFAWPLVPLPIYFLVFLVGIILGLLVVGWQVRLLTKRQSTWLSYERSAQVALLALVGSRVGALFGGGFLGKALYDWYIGDSQWLKTQGWVALVFSVTCFLIMATALLVEHWCAIEPPEDEINKGQANTSPV